jgi:NAD(P)-dependent dehydrogenase (short-subunit alcohol dehydrogenase family)
LITGTSSGIGLFLALELAERGQAGKCHSRRREGRQAPSKKPKELAVNDEALDEN